jgi:hypothetical protein
MTILIRLLFALFTRVGWILVIPLVARYGRRFWRWFWA